MASVTETTHLTARVPSRLVEDLNAIALENDRTLSAEVRRALRTYIERERDRDPDSGQAA